MKKEVKRFVSAMVTAVIAASSISAFAEDGDIAVDVNYAAGGIIQEVQDVDTIMSSVSAASSSSLSQTKVKITKSPQTVDTLNGVAAKYIPGTGNSNTGTYCCAQYVKNYYKKVYGVTVSNLTTGKTPAVNTGKIKNVTSSHSYKVGDIFYQTNSSGSGHWAIVKAVSGNTIYLIEQNWKWKSGSTTYAYKNRKITYKNGKWVNSSGSTVSGVKIFRWSK